MTVTQGNRCLESILEIFARTSPTSFLNELLEYRTDVRLQKFIAIVSEFISASETHRAPSAPCRSLDGCLNSQDQTNNRAYLGQWAVNGPNIAYDNRSGDGSSTDRDASNGYTAADSGQGDRGSPLLPYAQGDKPQNCRELPSVVASRSGGLGIHKSKDTQNPLQIILDAMKDSAKTGKLEKLFKDPLSKSIGVEPGAVFADLKDEVEATKITAIAKRWLASDFFTIEFCLYEKKRNLKPKLHKMLENENSRTKAKGEVRNFADKVTKEYAEKSKAEFNVLKEAESVATSICQGLKRLMLDTEAAHQQLPGCSFIAYTLSPRQLNRIAIGDLEMIVTMAMNIDSVKDLMQKASAWLVDARPYYHRQRNIALHKRESYIDSALTVLQESRQNVRDTSGDDNDADSFVQSGHPPDVQSTKSSDGGQEPPICDILAPLDADTHTVVQQLDISTTDLGLQRLIGRECPPSALSRQSGIVQVGNLGVSRLGTTNGSCPSDSVPNPLKRKAVNQGMEDTFSDILSSAAQSSATSTGTVPPARVPMQDLARIVQMQIINVAEDQNECSLSMDGDVSAGTFFGLGDGPHSMDGDVFTGTVSCLDGGSYSMNGDVFAGTASGFGGGPHSMDGDVFTGTVSCLDGGSYSMNGDVFAGTASGFGGGPHSMDGDVFTGTVSCLDGGSYSMNGDVFAGTASGFSRGLQSMNGDVFTGTVSCLDGGSYSMNGDVFVGTASGFSRGLQSMNGDVFEGTLSDFGGGSYLMNGGGFAGADGRSHSMDGDGFAGTVSGMGSGFPGERQGMRSPQTLQHHDNSEGGEYEIDDNIDEASFNEDENDGESEIDDNSTRRQASIHIHKGLQQPSTDVSASQDKLTWWDPLQLDNDMDWRTPTRYLTASQAHLANTQIIPASAFDANEYSIDTIISGLDRDAVTSFPNILSSLSPSQTCVYGPAS